jgi:hypothetical protein
MYANDFHVSKIKESIKDLAEKTRQLKREKSELKRLRRTGNPKPTIEHRTSESAIVLLDMPAVLDKLRTRSSCSRYHQLAYAFVRGMPYGRVEAKNNSGNRASVTVIAEVLLDFTKADRSVMRRSLPPLVEAWLKERDRCLLADPTPRAA